MGWAILMIRHSLNTLLGKIKQEIGNIHLFSYMPKIIHTSSLKISYTCPKNNFTSKEKQKTNAGASKERANTSIMHHHNLA